MSLYLFTFSAGQDDDRNVAKCPLNIIPIFFGQDLFACDIPHRRLDLFYLSAVRISVADKRG